jgi:transposase-like protein
MAAKSKTKVKPTKTKKGKRYSDEQRNEILAFVETTNAEKGRGGLTAAAAKYGVSPISISNWRKSGSGGASAPARIKGRPGRKPKSAGGDVLTQLVSLREEIVQLERAAADKRVAFDRLKKTL